MKPQAVPLRQCKRYGWFTVAVCVVAVFSVVVVAIERVTEVLIVSVVVYDEKGGGCRRQGGREA
jgi:hypothetical protein